MGGMDLGCMERHRNGIGINLNWATTIGTISRPGDIIVEKFELVTSSSARTFHPVRPAQQVVEDLAGSGAARVADDHRGATDDLDPVNEPGIVGGPGPAPASGLDLNLGAVVGQFHQAGRAREHNTLKRREQTEGVDVDPKVVNHSSELVALRRIIELSFITDHGIQVAERPHPLADQLEEVRTRLNDLGVG